MLEQVRWPQGGSKANKPMVVQVWWFQGQHTCVGTGDLAAWRLQGQQICVGTGAMVPGPAKLCWRIQTTSRSHGLVARLEFGEVPNITFLSDLAILAT